MEKSVHSVGVSAFITVLVVGILIGAGPAEAFNLNLNLLNHNVKKGETVKFNVGVSIDDNEFLNIDKFVLKLNGLNNNEMKACTFSPNGTVISGCEGMTIKQTGFTNFTFGYGYGFGKGKLTYEVTLNTAGVPVGVYKTLLDMIISGNSFEQKGNNLIIRGSVDNKNICSVRADDSSVVAEETTFSKNKLTFYVPASNAVGSDGSLTGKATKSRLDYKFKVKDVLENTNTELVVSVVGDYKINNVKNTESSTITYHKLTGMVDIHGPNINADNLDVSFVKGCN